MRLKPTCREVHRLVSEGLDRDLSVIERVRMRGHLLICTICRNFNHQMHFLHQAMSRLEVRDDHEAKGK